MHQSNVSQRPNTHRKHRFQSTNKENYNLQKSVSYPCTKEDIYYKKLMEMYHKYNTIAEQNSNKIESLKESSMLYKTISEKQA